MYIFFPEKSCVDKTWLFTDGPTEEGSDLALPSTRAGLGSGLHSPSPVQNPKVQQPCAK